MYEPPLRTMIDALRERQLVGWADLFLKGIEGIPLDELSLRDVTEIERLYFTLVDTR